MNVTFNFGPANVCSPVILRHVSPMTWIAATDYFMYFYVIVLFPLTSIQRFTNFTAL